ncbi:MAG: hypothetical protein JWN77_767 [Frankiales bacterium]|jgi:hypothetical protein|nr:hypothetical protein [Frankiales bacterium]
MRLEVLPPRLSDAGIPLRDAAQAVLAVADHRRDVLALVSDPQVQQALSSFLAAWELTAWGAADRAGTLAAGLDQAAATYRAADRL